MTDTQKFYYKNNRLQQLRGFCYAAQFGSVSRAAAYIGLEASSVSLQIKSLEDDLGVKLFERRGPQITLTNDGKVMYNLSIHHVEGIQNLFESFHEKVSEQIRTEIHIAANATSKNYLLPPVVSDYISENDDIYITLYDTEHDKAMQMLLNKKADMAALPWRDHKIIPDGLIYIPIYFCTPCLMTAHQHPLAGRKNLTIEEISKYELTLPEKDLRVIPNLYDIFSAKKINKRLRINFANSETGSAYIEHGTAITISSNVWLSDNDDKIIATPLSHLFPDVTYGYFVRDEKPLPEKIQKFISYARKDAVRRNRVNAS